MLAVVDQRRRHAGRLRDVGSPVAASRYPESAARALGLAAERAEWLRRPAGTIPELDGIDPAAARRVVDAALAPADDVWLDAGGRRERCSTPTGSRSCPSDVAATADEAVAAAAELGFPVVVKTAAAGAHKTESGGVALDLARRASRPRGGRSASAARCSCSRYLPAASSCSPASSRIPSSARSSRSAPAACFAELIGDADFRIAPLTDVDAEELVTGGKAGRLVRGFRGAPAGGRRCARRPPPPARRLAEDVPEVAELDLNPVLARPDGCVAVDARVRLRNPAEGRSLKSW